MMEPATIALFIAILIALVSLALLIRLIYQIRSSVKRLPIKWSRVDEMFYPYLGNGKRNPLFGKTRRARSELRAYVPFLYELWEKKGFRFMVLGTGGKLHEAVLHDRLIYEYYLLNGVEP